MFEALCKGQNEYNKPFLLIDNTKNKIESISKNSNLQKGVEEMKNIRKRTDGRWEGRITIEGKTYSVYAKTQKLCKEKLKNFKIPNTTKKKKSTTIDFFSFALKWLDLFKDSDLKENTYLMYKNSITKHLNKLNKPINTYTAEKLQEFINEFGKTRTKEIAVMTIKQVFAKAQELKIIKNNPALNITKGKIEQKVVTSYTLQEQKTILSNLKNDKISKHILGYLLTGARLNELKTIKRENIKNNYLFIDGTKTKNSKRWVKISTTYQNILLNENEPLFTYTDKTIQKLFKNFLKEIGINGTIHKLRHTFNTNLYYLGATDMERKEFMGHSSITVTNDIYTHLDKTITKNDIINLYKDLYPNFDPRFDPRFWTNFNFYPLF